MTIDLAATIAAVASLVTVVGQVVLQIMQFLAQKEARQARAALSDKVDDTAAAVAENTTLTKDTALQVKEVHAATTAIAEATGQHQILTHDGG